ncbi:MAG: hypothetical protein PHI32_05960 [Dysgonamonadaceae bacterium]|nr:hypothetical protein [Dysgonamonadaceae bacterium]
MKEIIKVSVHDPIFNDWNVIPASIFEQSESLQLKRALRPDLSPYMDIKIEEYESIKDKMQSFPIMISISSYYDKPSYYSVMPQPIFDALETAALNGDDFALVDKVLYDKMIFDYKTKTAQWKKQGL